MQKKLWILLGISFLIVFFLVQNQGRSGKKEAKGNSPTSAKKQEERPGSKEIKVQESTKRVEMPKESVKHEKIIKGIKKSVPDGEIERIKAKGDRELQKELFADIEKRMIKEMQTVPDCLENADSKDKALECSKKLHDINREFELVLGINQEDSMQDTTDTLVWNETTKENMIKQLDEGIEPMQELFACIQASETNQEQEKCFEVEQN